MNAIKSVFGQERFESWRKPVVRCGPFTQRSIGCDIVPHHKLRDKRSFRSFPAPFAVNVLDKAMRIFVGIRSNMDRAQMSIQMLIGTGCLQCPCAGLGCCKPEGPNGFAVVKHLGAPDFTAGRMFEFDLRPDVEWVALPVRILDVPLQIGTLDLTVSLPQIICYCEVRNEHEPVEHRA